MKTPISCPRCRSYDIDIIEERPVSSVWHQTKEGLVDIEGVSGEGLGSVPSILAVTAQCRNCRHFWNLRKVLQITDLYPEILKGNT